VSPIFLRWPRVAGVVESPAVVLGAAEATRIKV